jgi:sugar/nucleoside kinase (ribokinase family)
MMVKAMSQSIVGKPMGGKDLQTLRKQLETRRGSAWDVVGLGECSVDEVWVLPGPIPVGGKVRAAHQERLGGGQIATALVACARLGLKVAFAGVVGDDAAGRTVLEGLEQERVDVSQVKVVAGVTRSALVLVDGAGERTVIEYSDRKVVLQAAATAEIARARVVHLDATWPAVSLQAARAAREHGVPVSLDLDHVGPGVAELIAHADVCITSEGVPQTLTGESDLEQALRKLQSMTPASLVGCTLGARGAALLADDHLLMSPAFPVDVVDTTACGDTFHAAVLRALLDEKPVGDVLRFANAAAALKCRALGRRGCPTKAEVDELLARI